MKKFLVITLAIVAALAIGAYALNFTGKSVQIVDSESSVTAISAPTPTATPEIPAEEAAWQWRPGANSAVDELFTNPNFPYGTDGNTTCGFPNNAQGFMINEEAFNEIFPDGIYVKCSNFMAWQARILDPEMPENETADDTATPAVEEVEVVAENVITDTTTADGVWRVDLWQDLSYGPELGFTSPGFGTSDHEIGIAVGVEFRVETVDGWVEIGGGCQQIMVLSNSYARDAGGSDWGYRSYRYNPEVTQEMDELVVLAHQWARQQINDEDCPELEDDELLKHVYIFWQDSEGNDHLQLWNDFRRASGEDNVIMIHPSDGAAKGWHCGYGDSPTNIGDNGECLVEDVAEWGWLGGGVVHPWPGE